MPFICLSNTLIPDGTVQILDLQPNESQRVNSLDPPGQTRYLNRFQNDAVQLDSAGNITTTTTRGLAAYLLDRLEPGGLSTASAFITLVTVVAGNTVTIGDVTFTAVAGGAVPANQEFNHKGAGTDILSANSLVAAINDPATQALFLASWGVGVAATNGAGTLNVVTVAATTTGAIGNLPLSKVGVPISLFPLTNNMARTKDRWTAAEINNVANEIVALFNARLPIKVSDIDVILGAYADTAFVSPGGRATLGEILSILAGRGFELPEGSRKGFLDYGWYLTNDGSFTRSVTVRGGTMLGGEIVGNVVEQREIKPIRYTVDGTSFEISLNEGHIAKFAQGVTLFPDSSLNAFVPTFSQPGPKQAQVDHARIVIVYADNGEVLA